MFAIDVNQLFNHKFMKIISVLQVFKIKQEYQPFPKKISV